MRVFGIGVLALSMGVTSPVWAGEDPEPDQGGEQGDQGGDQGGGDQGGGDQGGDRQDDQQSEAGSSTTTFGYAKAAPTEWEHEYLEDVAKAMKPGTAGSTKVDYSFDSDYGYGGKRDLIKKCRVKITITIQLAKWTHRGKRKTADAEWDRFVRELEKHENGHADIAKRELKDVGKLCIGKTDAGCKQAIDDAIAAQQKKQDAYDEGNNHGAKERAELDGSKDPRPAEKDEQSGQDDTQ